MSHFFLFLFLSSTGTNKKKRQLGSHNEKMQRLSGKRINLSDWNESYGEARMIWQILDDEGKINESGVLGKIFQAAFG